MKRLIFATLTLAAAHVAQEHVAQAHETLQGPNGGAVVEASGRHVEFVANGAALLFILTDEKDQPIPSGEVKNARALVMEAGKTTSHPLSPAAPNRLTAQLPQPLTAGARVVVSLTLPQGAAIQARFVKN